MDGTIIQQGRFPSDGTDTFLSIRSDVDWIRVYNYSNIGDNAQFQGTEFYWQRGMAANDGLVSFRGTDMSQVISMSTAAVGVGAGAVGGFTLFDESVQTPGVAFAITAISVANPPVVTSAADHNLTTGDFVRLSTIAGAPQFAGIDFQIIVLSPTTFSLAFAPQLTVAGTTGFAREIQFNPIFYPRRRFIMDISQDPQAEVITSVDHGYTVGQEVRMNVPAVYGMVEMDGLSGTIVSVPDAHTFVIDIDSSAFTAFAFPLAADVPFTPATVVPLGEDTSVAIANNTNILADATEDQSEIGIKLAAGISSPAGEAGDIIYWVAGKSFSVDNE